MLQEAAVASAREAQRNEKIGVGRGVPVCLALAMFFGYAIPVIDYKFFNTFLGATHLPPGALAALLVLLLVVNPLLGMLSQRFRFSARSVFGGKKAAFSS